MADRARIPLGDVPEGGCVAVADGRVLLTKVDGEVRAYENSCLHQQTPLDGGFVRDGVLTCPMHFWRYRLADGSHLGSRRALPRYDVEVDDDTVTVEVPDDEPSVSLAERLREHARTWRRDA